VFSLISAHLSEIPVVLQGRGLSRAATILGSIFLNYWTLAFSITGASFACTLLSQRYSTFVHSANARRLIFSGNVSYTWILHFLPKIPGR
jgi:hypothetical protein